MTSSVNHDVLIGWTTAQRQNDALRLARGLIENRLAACAQVDGPLSSTYRWKDAIETSKEWRVTVKFPRDRAAEIETWLMENHPYDEPQWVAVAAEEVSDAYAEWVKKETRRGNP